MDEEVSQAWVIVTRQLSNSIQLHNANTINAANTNTNGYFVQSVHILCKFRLADVLIRWYMDDVRKFFVKTLSPRFWSHFEDFQAMKQAECKKELYKWVDRRVTKAINEIYDTIRMLEENVNNLMELLAKSENIAHKQPQHYVNEFQPQQILRVVLFADDNNRTTFQEILFLFFLKHFLRFNKSQEINQKINVGDEEHEEEESDDNLGEGEEMDIPGDPESNFADFCAKLNHLDLLVISEEVFTEILFDHIESYIVKRCKEKFERPMLPKIQHWANVVVFEWLKLVICLDSGSTNKEDKAFCMFQQWKTRLEFNIYETFADLRIREIFDLIKYFPDSTPALLDLQMCLLKTSQHAELVEALKRAHRLRLLHPGANTSDIISQYISTIKALRLIDPTGVILDDVGDPIRNYLKQREDTIRCIVTSFTTDDEDGHSELFKEFSRGEGGKGQLLLNRDDEDDDDIDDDDVDKKDDNEGSEGSDAGNARAQIWHPDPLEASPSKRKHRMQDTISMLVNIYGSSELFVNEYRNMLADRLIAITDYDVDKEVRNLELLKLRFGESNLHNCEIMIKDMADSKRINQLVHATLQKENPSNGFKLDMIIVSHLFWPTFKDENIVLPEPVKSKFDQYCKQYEHHKRPRQLTKKQHLGTVQLDLEFDDKVRSFSVSPVHAAIICLFQDENKTIPLDTIATKIGMTREGTRKKLVYWVNNQILREVQKDVFELVELNDEEDSATSTQQPPGMMADEDDGGKLASAADLHNEKMRVCEQFIMSMLTNLGTLPVERIHMLLSTFVGESYTASLSDLKLFLGKLINEEKIDLTGNEYSKK